MLRKLLVAVLCAGAFALAGCSGSGANLTQIDTAIGSQNVQTGIQFACLALQGAEAGWNVWTNTHTVSAADKANAESAIAGVAALCTPPYPQNTSDAVAKVIAASVAVISSLKAENGTTAATPAATSAATTTTTQ